jgi:hypothetical protein
MNVFTHIARDWGPVMRNADRIRVVLAFGFIFGAVSHIGWVIAHGDVWYRGPAPDWAPMFWYGLCVVDPVVWWILLKWPRAGIAAGCLTMAVSLIVNWTQFPTFEFKFNYVLLGLTLFGVIFFSLSPWLWRASHWRPNASSRASSG